MGNVTFMSKPVSKKNSFANEMQNMSFMQQQMGDANVGDVTFNQSQLNGSRIMDSSLMQTSQEIKLNESEYINVESANVTMNMDAPIAEVSEEDIANSIRSQSLNQPTSTEN